MRTVPLIALISTMCAPDFCVATTANAGSVTPVHDFCGALSAVERGGVLPVELRGAVLLGFELQVFFDPNQVKCELDIQPSSWLEFSPSSRGELGRLRGSKSDSEILLVSLRGDLEGPPVLGPDRPELSESLAYVQRTAGSGYGHGNAFRTRIIVREILSASPAPSDLSVRPVVSRSSYSESRLDILHAELPVYPARAQRAGLEGDVEVQFSVRDGRLEGSAVVSGDRMFHDEARTFVHGLRFDPRASFRQTLRIEYRLERRLMSEHRNARIELDLPGLVRITAARDDW